MTNPPKEARRIAFARIGGAMLGIAAAVVSGTSASGCSKPEPPRLTPKSATLTKIDLEGVDVRAVFDAFNPNGFGLAVRRVTGRVVVDGRFDLGTVSVDKPVALPAGITTTIEVPLSWKWNGPGVVGALSAAKRAVPYTVEGVATIGGDRLSVDAPFTLHGTITEEQVVAIALRALEKLPRLLPPSLAAPGSSPR